MTTARVEKKAARFRLAVTTEPCGSSRRARRVKDVCAGNEVALIVKISAQFGNAAQGPSWGRAREMHELRQCNCLIGTPGESKKQLKTALFAHRNRPASGRFDATRASAALNLASI
ncbi:MAG TPA: hypothetical protein VNY08_15590 [Bradyrhizobium sp.]|nr:hypothetical protein [Bradyrhizobium sp.]